MVESPSTYYIEHLKHWTLHFGYSSARMSPHPEQGLHLSTLVFSRVPGPGLYTQIDRMSCIYHPLSVMHTLRELYLDFTSFFLLKDA